MLFQSQVPPLQWGEFLMRFSALSGLLVRRADETVMFFHSSLREWLIRRGDRSQKFLCEPRQGHAAIAFRMSRQEAPLSPDKTLELGHHILKVLHLLTYMGVFGFGQKTPPSPDGCIDHCNDGFSK